MKTHFYFIAVALILSIFSCQPDQKKELKIDQLFSDFIVLQQKQEVAFWGVYTPGQEVTISADWGEKVWTKADNHGMWKLKLPTPPAGGPYSIKIETEDSTIVLNDVLVEEVWLASG